MAPMIIYDFDPRNLPPDMLQAIGVMVAAASQTESCMQDLIGALLNIDNVETIALTAHMSAPLKDHVVRALIELNAENAAIVDHVDDLLDKLNAAIEKRNTVVHNALCRHPDTGEILSMREKARGSLQVSLQPMTVEQIEQDALLIYEVGMDIVRFMSAVGIEPHERSGPLREPLDRRKSARQKRRDARVGD